MSAPGRSRHATPRNDREVFEHLIADDETPAHVDFLAYAVFAHEKREWIRLWESQHGGSSPSQGDIDNWIFNLTESQFLGMRVNAERFFLAAADDYLDQRLTVEREAILRSAIMSEVRSASDWRKQLGMALLTAIVAPLILGGILYAIAFYSAYVTPIDIAKRLHLPGTEAPSSLATPPPKPASP